MQKIQHLRSSFQNRRSLMPLNIVYIDDEADLCKLFKQSFESDQVQVRAFVNPEEAILEVAKYPADYVFLDYRLPNTNGDLVARKIDSKIPKILITGDLSVVPETHFIKIFHKPFRYQEMESFIKQLHT